MRGGPGTRCGAGIAIALLVVAILAACDDRIKDSDTGQAPLVTRSFPITDDAMVSSAVPGGHYGDGQFQVSTIVYGDGLTYITNTLIGLPPLPDSVKPDQIVTATLVLRFAGAEDSLPFAIAAHRIVRTWMEDSVTWSNAPPFDPADLSVGHVTGGTVSLNVLGAHIDPLAYGVALTSSSPEQWFYSSEDPLPTRRPVLVVTYRECQ